jgi:hypothetical protein
MAELAERLRDPKNLDQQPAVRSGSHKATDQGLRLISQFKNDLGVLTLLRGLA